VSKLEREVVESISGPDGWKEGRTRADAHYFIILDPFLSSAMALKLGLVKYLSVSQSQKFKRQ
jgi:hypothetical protein